MPRLNWVFEELGIHHENRKVPDKILASIARKEKKTLAKNATAAVETKKRKGQPYLKVMSKKLKVVDTSAAARAMTTCPASSSKDASEDDSEEDTEEVHETSVEEDAATDLVSGGYLEMAAAEEAAVDLSSDVGLGAEVVGTSAGPSEAARAATASAKDDPFPFVLGGILAQTCRPPPPPVVLLRGSLLKCLGPTVVGWWMCGRRTTTSLTPHELRLPPLTSLCT
jgi:hypothetical protein